MRFTILLVLIAMGAYTPLVYGVKLYKWIDEDGNVTYQDHPPPANAGRVEEKEIDPDEIVTKFVLPKGEGRVTPRREAQTPLSPQPPRGDTATRGGIATTPSVTASSGTSATATPNPTSVPGGTGGATATPGPTSVPGSTGGGL